MKSCDFPRSWIKECDQEEPQMLCVQSAADHFFTLLILSSHTCLCVVFEAHLDLKWTFSFCSTVSRSALPQWAAACDAACDAVSPSLREDSSEDGFILQRLSDGDVVRCSSSSWSWLGLGHQQVWGFLSALDPTSCNVEQMWPSASWCSDEMFLARCRFLDGSVWPGCDLQPSVPVSGVRGRLQRCTCCWPQASAGCWAERCGAVMFRRSASACTFRFTHSWND